MTMKKGTKVGVAMWHSKPGKGLSYSPFRGYLLEDCGSGWDVVDVMPSTDTEPRSVYSFSVYRLSKEEA